MALSWSMDKIGPICRSVEDCALVFAAIHGPDGQDITVVDRPFVWNPAMNLNIAACFPGDSQVADAGTSFSLETAVGVQGFVTDAGTTYRSETGFNYIVNQRRSDSN